MNPYGDILCAMEPHLHHLGVRNWRRTESSRTENTAGQLGKGGKFRKGLTKKEEEEEEEEEEKEEE